ncbi:MAG: UvrD-helicase domain-containing protein [candidate division KSB1 bacterium]|nr:UvrD-helicase domain-containing protein [candidate division KSB1 bacterium]
MKFIADLHIHSHYSRATSRDLTFEQLYRWAQLKGIQVVASGDITHPGWLDEIKTKLEPAEPGFFRLKAEYARSMNATIPAACQSEVRFVLSGEISNIYKKGDHVRKIHNVVFFPSIEVAQKFQVTLEKIGNIRSDGRPILGLDARDLLELVLQSHEWSFLIPAHIWTPWFSVLGSKSGFDSIADCFADLTPQIFALETGLSSDPPMNWMLSQLDRFTLVSNSDAHSPAKLGREANLFDCEFSFSGMLAAMKDQNAKQFLGTIEFFPEEGKYHLDGHRNCQVRLTPAETASHQGLCPVCGKKVTVGVLNRVEALADRPFGAQPPTAKPYYSLIPLPEVLAEISGVGVGTKAVATRLEKLLRQFGSEINILTEIPLIELQRAGGSLLAEGIRRMRQKEVQIAAGYDGEFGIIKLFSDDERRQFSAQPIFFNDDNSVLPGAIEQPVPSVMKDQEFAYGQSQSPGDLSSDAVITTQSEPDDEGETGLNRRQQEAVEYVGTSLLIAAGPGTGKTHTLTQRIAFWIQNKGVPPDQVLAITFTNRAAQEMRERLQAILDKAVAEAVTIKTFHALGASILRQEAERLNYPSSFLIYGENDVVSVLKMIAPTLGLKEIRSLADQISRFKNSFSFCSSENRAASSSQEQFNSWYEQYQQMLQAQQSFDYDDLILMPIRLFQEYPAIQQKYQQRFQWIFVDEFQDINQPQYELLKLLTTSATHICAIGDPDQAIYGFRGSDRRFFKQFEQDFPNCRVIRLEKNYRSVSTILKASTQVISKNPDHQPYNLWSPLVSRTRIDIFQTPTEKAEAETIVHQIEKMMGATSFFSVDSGRAGDEESQSCAGFSEIAVLYRLGAQVAALEEAFLRAGIPYQTLGEQPFYEIPEVKEIISFLKVFQHPRADWDLQRVIHIAPTGIGEPTLRSLVSYQRSNALSLWEAMQRCRQIAPLSEVQKQPIERWVSRMKEVMALVPHAPVGDIIERILTQFGLLSYYKNDRRRQYYWQLLLQNANAAPMNLTEFLDQIALQKETDVHNPRAEKVTLLTLHAAKGLEFPIVFIAGCEEGLIPYRHPQAPANDIEEERRLFYVGMTRAKQRLILLHTKSRFLFGERKNNRPSRFLFDIEEALKQQRQAQLKERSRENELPAMDSQLKLF